MLKEVFRNEDCDIFNNGDIQCSGTNAFGCRLNADGTYQCYYM